MSGGAQLGPPFTPVGMQARAKPRLVSPATAAGVSSQRRRQSRKKIVEENGCERAHGTRRDLAKPTGGSGDVGPAAARTQSCPRRLCLLCAQQRVHRRAAHKGATIQMQPAQYTDTCHRVAHIQCTKVWHTVAPKGSKKAHNFLASGQPLRC